MDRKATELEHATTVAAVAAAAAAAAADATAADATAVDDDATVPAEEHEGVSIGAADANGVSVSAGAGVGCVPLPGCWFAGFGRWKFRSFSLLC